jgi:hypothetical protein
MSDLDRLRRRVAAERAEKDAAAAQAAAALATRGALEAAALRTRRIQAGDVFAKAVPLLRAANFPGASEVQEIHREKVGFRRKRRLVAGPPVVAWFLVREREPEMSSDPTMSEVMRHQELLPRSPEEVFVSVDGEILWSNHAGPWGRCSILDAEPRWLVWPTSSPQDAADFFAGAALRRTSR